MLLTFSLATFTPVSSPSPPNQGPTAMLSVRYRKPVKLLPTGSVVAIVASVQKVQKGKKVSPSSASPLRTDVHVPRFSHFGLTPFSP
jgi:hypothetical protein